MASPHNDELEYSMPEMVFPGSIIASDVDGSGKNESYMKCPLCGELAKNFYCADCVRNGNFTHSKKICIERSFMFRHLLSRFAEKKPRKYKVEQEKSVILKRYETALAQKKEIENVKYNMINCKEKIQILKKTIHNCKAEIIKGEKSLENSKEFKFNSIQKSKELDTAIKKKNDVYRLRDAELKRKEIELESLQSALQSVTNRRVKELVTHIFPITKVPPQYYRDTTASEEGQYAELEEAQKTTYIQGQWVIAGSAMDNMQYRIVEPCIPSTGDYSAYPAWCSSFTSMTTGADHIEGVSRDNLSNADKYKFDVAYGIGGSLSYIAQLVNILAFYMDVHLPKRSSINDFSREECVEKFYHNVAKLNANIINLCLSQHVDISELSAHRTVSNLLLLIDSKKNESKRYLSLEEQEELLESLEDSIFKDLPPFFDESDNDNSETEFVHVSDEDIFEVPEAEPVSNPPESLYSSVVSLWKAAIGQR